MLDLGDRAGAPPRSRRRLAALVAGVAMLATGAVTASVLLRPAPVLSADEVQQALREFSGRTPTANVVEDGARSLPAGDDGRWSPDGCGLLLSPVYAPGPAGRPPSWVHGVLDGGEGRYALVGYLYPDADAAEATLVALRAAVRHCSDVVWSPAGAQGRFRYTLSERSTPGEEVWFQVRGPGRRQSVHVRRTLNAVVYQLGYPGLGPAAQAESARFAAALGRTARLG